jgi:hypothetical protein
MGKSSIHISAAKAGSEEHNLREKELEYIRKDLTHKNSKFYRESIAKTLAECKAIYQEKVGQKMQEKAAPIREAVLLVEPHHTIKDLQKVADNLDRKFGIHTIQGYIHQDEGHWHGQEWKPNLHAHLVFDWQNKETGRSIKLSKEDLSEMQTIVANDLGMERGVSSSIKHLTALEYKNKKEFEKLQEKYGLDKSLEEMKQLTGEKEKIKQEIPQLKQEKEKLIFETTLHKSNLIHIQNIEKSIKEELKNERNQGRGMSR